MNQLKVLILKVFSFLSDKFICHIWSLQGEGPITLLQRAHQNTGNLMTTVQFLIVIFIIIFSKYSQFLIGLNTPANSSWPAAVDQMWKMFANILKEELLLKII